MSADFDGDATSHASAKMLNPAGRMGRSICRQRLGSWTSHHRAGWVWPRSISHFRIGPPLKVRHLGRSSPLLDSLPLQSEWICSWIPDRARCDT